MKKYLFIFVSALLIAVLAGCGAKGDNKADPSKEAAALESASEEAASEEAASEETASEEAASEETAEPSSLSDEEALSAVKNYCYDSNPDLKDIEKDGEYELYWEVESGGDKEIVVLFRSYTGAQIRYHIDRNSGDTYVTEFVPGITEEEEKTDESFNIRDYM